MDQNQADFSEQILKRAARQSEREKRVNEAIRLYNLAGEYETVVECLARALGDHIAEPSGGGDEGRELSNTAKEVLNHYEKTNKASGKSRDAVVRLVRVRDARVAKDSGQPEKALEVQSLTTLKLIADTFWNS